MRSLVVAVLMVSGGLAVVARCFEAGGDSSWAVPSVLFGAGIVLASAGTFLFVRSINRRSRAGAGRPTAGVYTGYNPWSAYAASNDAAAIAGGGSDHRGDDLGMPLSRAEVKEAARMLMFAGEEELERRARARTAGRSACRRRAHARRAASPQPKRRHVRARPRLMA